MTLKSNIVVYRIFFVIIGVVALFYMELNPAFFGFLMVVSLIMLNMSRQRILTIGDTDATFKTRRLLPLSFLNKTQTINFEDIKSIHHNQRGFEPTVFALKFLLPGATLSSTPDQLIIATKEGDVHLEQIGSKKQFRKAVELLNQKLGN